MENNFKNEDKGIQLDLRYTPRSTFINFLMEILEDIITIRKTERIYEPNLKKFVKTAIKNINLTIGQAIYTMILLLRLKERLGSHYIGRRLTRHKLFFVALMLSNKLIGLPLELDCLQNEKEPLFDANQYPHFEKEFKILIQNNLHISNLDINRFLSLYSVNLL